MQVLQMVVQTCYILVFVQSGERNGVCKPYQMDQGLTCTGHWIHSGGAQPCDEQPTSGCAGHTVRLSTGLLHALELASKSLYARRKILR